MAMDPELKARWIEALESGKYKKGTGKLCRMVRGVDEWCCLGVLADIAVSGTWLPYCPGYSTSTYTLDVDGGRHARSDAFLPSSISKELGIIMNQNRLAVLNDSNPTWKEAITYIKRYL